MAPGSPKLIFTPIPLTRQLTYSVVDTSLLVKPEVSNQDNDDNAILKIILDIDNSGQ